MMKRTIIRKKVTLALALTLVLSVYATTQSIPAYALTDESVTPSNNIPGQQSNYTVKFSVGSLLRVQKVLITVPSSYDLSPSGMDAVIVKIEGFRVGTTLTVDNVVDADGKDLTLTQERHTLFRPSQIKIAEFAGMVNPTTEGPHNWNIKLFDRFSTLVDEGNVLVTLKNIEIVGRADGTGAKDEATTTTGNDLTLNTLKVNTMITVGTSSLLLTSNKIDTTATGGDDDLTVAVAGTTKMVVEESAGTGEGSGLVRIGQAGLAANTLLFELRDGASTVFKVDKEGDLQADGSLTVAAISIESSSPMLTLKDVDIPEEAEILFAATGADMGTLSIQIDEADAAELTLTQAGVLKVGPASIEIDGPNNKIKGSAATEIATTTGALKIDPGDTEAGITVSTTGAISDIDGVLVLDDTTSIGSATTGITIDPIGQIDDIDSDFINVLDDLNLVDSETVLTLVDVTLGTGVDDASIGVDGGVLSFSVDTTDGAEMTLTGAGLLTLGTGTLKLNGNTNTIGATVGDLELQAADSTKMIIEASPDPTEGQALVRIGQAAATAANTLLLEVREAGSTVFKVDREGDVQMDGTLTIGSSIEIDGANEKITATTTDLTLVASGDIVVNGETIESNSGALTVQTTQAADAADLNLKTTGAGADVVISSADDVEISAAATSILMNAGGGSTELTITSGVVDAGANTVKADSMSSSTSDTDLTLSGAGSGIVKVSDSLQVGSSIVFQGELTSETVADDGDATLPTFTITAAGPDEIGFMHTVTCADGDGCTVSTFADGVTGQIFVVKNKFTSSGSITISDNVDVSTTLSPGDASMYIFDFASSTWIIINFF